MCRMLFVIHGYCPGFILLQEALKLVFRYHILLRKMKRFFIKLTERIDRIYVTCGERELRFGMQWSVEYSLGHG